MVKYLILLLLFTANSCSVIEPIVPQEFETESVLSGFIEPDSVMLRLEYSRPISNNLELEPITYINDATVQILDEQSGRLVGEFFSNGNGRYEGPINLIPGQSYSVVANSPSAGELSTLPVVIPMPIGEVNASVTDYTGREDLLGFRSQDVIGNLTIDRSQDADAAEQAYLIELLGADGDRRHRLVVRDELDEDFSRTCGLLTSTVIIFTDLCFRDPSIQIPFSAFGQADQDFPVLEVYFYRISSLTHEYALAESQGGDGFEVLFARPQLSITNVIGGLGYVAARTGKLIILPL